MTDNKKKKTKLETVLIPRAADIMQMIDEGMSEKKIAQRLGVSYSTFKSYKKQLKEYLQNKAKEDGDDDKIQQLEAAMFEAAIGFTKTVTKAMKLRTVEYKDGKRVRESERIEYYTEDIFIPPSVSAGQFLLKNWNKTKYSNNPAELEQKKEEFEYKKTLEEW